MTESSGTEASPCLGAVRDRPSPKDELHSSRVTAERRECFFSTPPNTSTVYEEKAKNLRANDGLDAFVNLLYEETANVESNCTRRKIIDKRSRIQHPTLTDMKEGGSGAKACGKEAEVDG